MKSAQRNILSFANFVPVFEDIIPGPDNSYEPSKTTIHFSMHLNNKIAKTYIVKEEKIPEIKKMLAEKKVA